MIPIEIVLFLLRSPYAFPLLLSLFLYTSLCLRLSLPYLKNLENSKTRITYPSLPVHSRKNRHKRAIAYSAYKFLAREVFPFPFFLLLS